MDDVHLNTEIYTNPLVFDPDRYGSGREEDKRVPLSYVAQGTGRRPCTSMRIPKLDIKTIVFFFLALYQYELVDKNHKFPDLFRRTCRNDRIRLGHLGSPTISSSRKLRSKET